MDGSVLVDVFEKYGWPGLMCGLLVFAVFYLANKQMSSNKKVESSLDKLPLELSNTISTQLTTINKSNEALIASMQAHNDKMFEYIVNGRRQEHAQSVDNRFSVTAGINDEIRDLQNKVDATRVSVIEFHNSKENFIGLSFIWYDIQYERQAKDVYPISAKVKNLQASNIIPIVEEINQDHEYHMAWYNEDNFDDLFEKSSVLYEQLVNELKVTNIIYVGLYDPNNRIIGLLAIEYNYDAKADIPEYIDNFISSSHRISTLLSIHKQELNGGQETL